VVEISQPLLPMGMKTPISMFVTPRSVGKNYIAPELPAPGASGIALAG
jgi:hypothetical protein